MLKRHTSKLRAIDLDNIDTGAYLKGLTEGYKKVRIELDSQNNIRVGRSTKQDLVISDPSISYQHAIILRNNDNTYSLMDLDSKNGTRVNGERFELVKLKNGDVVQFGPVEFVFYSGGNELPESDFKMFLEDEHTQINTTNRLTPVWFKKFVDVKDGYKKAYVILTVSLLLIALSLTVFLIRALI